MHVLQGYRRQKQPDSPGELLGLAWLATEVGDRQAAAEYYRQAQKLRPHDPQIAQLLLQCQVSRKDWAQALGNLENQKDNPAAPLEMARIYLLRGQYEGVKAMGERIPAGSPDRVAYLRLLVQACRGERNYPGGLAGPDAPGRPDLPGRLSHGKGPDPGGPGGSEGPGAL